MPTLSQRLGSFPTKSRAENFPLCRRDCPLPPAINGGGLDGLREEKIGSKNRKKPASSPVFSAASLSLYTLSPPCSQRLQATLPSARLSPSPPKGPPFSSTAAAANQHHHFRFIPSLVSAAAAPTPPQTLPPASGRLPRPPPTSRQTSDSSFFSSARSSPTSLRNLQLQSCMQNVNLLFTFYN